MPAALIRSTPATDAILAAAKAVGIELEATGCPTFPGIRAEQEERIRELSGYAFSGYPIRYAVDSVATEAFWTARRTRTQASE